jgi:hypothetical protein
MKLRSVMGGVLLGALLSSNVAFAQDLGSDEVSLKNGGSIRGTVVSVEPGNKVVILEFGAKEPRTVTWAEVADVQKGKYAKAEPGPEGPGYSKSEPKEEPEDSAEPEPKLGDPGVVRLHVDSPEPVEVTQSRVLARGVIGGYGFVTGATIKVCDSPCDTLVRTKPGDTFEITGDMPGKSFSLDGLKGDVTARVEPGNKGARTAGIIMISVGGAAVLGSVSMFVVGALSETDDFLLVGGGMLGGGAAVLTGGILAAVFSRTSVEVTEGSPTKSDAAEVFEIDRRTVARAPRYWAGEF